MSEIGLNVGEISRLKTIGLGWGVMAGSQLTDRADEMDGAEFLDTLTRELKDAVYPSREKADTGRRKRRP
ncbi:MAG: hypothetical protein ACR2II_10100 [Chthoniobacterales bacterium]